MGGHVGKSNRQRDLEAEHRAVSRDLDAVRADAFRFAQMYPSATRERGMFQARIEELATRLKDIDRKIAEEWAGRGGC